MAVVESLPFKKAKGGRIFVNQYLEVSESPGIYVLGHCAHLLQENGSVPYPSTQQVAQRQGPACARNIIGAMQGKDQHPFRYKFKGQVIYRQEFSAGTVGESCFQWLRCRVAAADLLSMDIYLISRAADGIQEKTRCCL
ncbi:MAG: hypothetical protein J7L92_06275 [Dehalococcoidia bacterium]|nr:hypothetical protein [Dehalococcoidia bacterium]